MDGIGSGLRGESQDDVPGARDELEDFARSFNGLLDRLHVALERQRQFTGQASHQLRTPLKALIAAIEVARRRRRTVDEHERMLDGLHGDAVRRWRVVEALLFLARADADAGLPDLECLDLGVWASDHLRAWSGHERAAVRFEGCDGEPLWTRASAAARPVAGQPAREPLCGAIAAGAWGGGRRGGGQGERGGLADAGVTGHAELPDDTRCCQLSSADEWLPFPVREASPNPFEGAEQSDPFNGNQLHATTAGFEVRGPPSCDRRDC